ncbi:MAG: glycosyltransferase family 4 protein [Pusillimonas sp.]|nr:glycosyltransferase family 4 protein [Pusillimonas sp.]
MNILFFVSSLSAGGAERVAVTLANAWAGQGYRVTLVPTYGQKSESFYKVDSAVRVHWLTDTIAGSMLYRQMRYFGKLLALRKMIRHEQPDVVVSFLTNVNVTVLGASLGMRVPVVVCERTNPLVSRHSRGALDVLRRVLYPRAAAVCVQTPAAAAYFQTRLKKNPPLFIIPNPLPADLCKGPRATLSADAMGRYRLVALGRLVPEKQFSHLVRAFAGLAKQFPDWDLWIYGEGPERAQLGSLIQQFELNQRIFLPGTTVDPWGVLRESSLFAMTSSVEGFPNVLLEAMGCGLPSIAYDCPSGPADLMGGGRAGVLVPLNDEQSYASALGALMANPGVRRQLGQLASQRVIQRFSLPVVLTQWNQMFAQMGVRHD